jgi:hypothetical protein
MNTHVWILHHSTGAVISVHGSENSAIDWRAIRGHEYDWTIQRWSVRR